MKLRWSVILTAVLVISTAVISMISTRPLAQGLPETVIGYGETREGELTVLHPEALFTLYGQQGDLITATLTADPSSNFNAFLVLLDAGQQQVLTVARAAESGKTARLRFFLPKPGAYILKVTRTDHGVGRFALMLQLENPTPTPSAFDNAPRAAAIQPDQPIQAVLRDEAAFYLYRFAAKAGESVRFEITVENNLPIGLYLYDAALNNLLSSAELGKPLTVTLPANGFYWLIVARVAVTGSASFTLRWSPDAARGALTPPPSDYPLIVPGQPQQGMIGPAFAIPYRFYARAGSSLQIDLDSAADLSLLALIVDEQGNQIAAGERAIRGAKLANGGGYVLVVARRGGPNDTHNGAFNLTLQSALDPVTLTPTRPAPTPHPTVTLAPQSTAAAEITALPYGGSVNGSISDTAYIHYYGFAGQKGDQISLRLRVTSGDYDFQPVIYLYGYEAGRPVLVSSSADNAIEHVALPFDGTYLVVMTRLGATEGRGTGDYVLSLEK